MTRHEGRTPDEDGDAVIACSLAEDEAKGQLDQWAALRSECVRGEMDEAGARLWFDPGVEEALRAVAAREAQCCSFLSLRVSADEPLVRLDISSTQAAARPVIETLVAYAAGTLRR